LNENLKEIGELHSSISSLDVLINDSERANDRYQDHQKKLLRQKDTEIIRGQDLAHSLKQNEQILLQATLEGDHLRKDLDSTGYSGEALVDRNYELKQEVESLGEHAALLGAQNNELQRELNNFVEVDDVVRRNLDRKDHVYMFRTKVDEVIKKSY
jgi:hypothetical protein